MRNFNIWSEYYICYMYIMCACMYAEIMWGCSYTCMYVRCVYIRTNANLVSVRTRLIGASLSKPHTSNATDFRLYVSIYVSMRTSLPPKAPDACTQESYSNYCTLSQMSMSRTHRISLLYCHTSRPCLQ